VQAWANRREEFVKRESFALIASLSVHDKGASDAQFEASLELCEEGASDERNFVKKAVSWALRSVGKRNAALNASAIAVSRRLVASPHPAAAWVGRDALRELGSESVACRIESRRARRAAQTGG